MLLNWLVRNLSNIGNKLCQCLFMFILFRLMSLIMIVSRWKCIHYCFYEKAVASPISCMGVILKKIQNALTQEYRNRTSYCFHVEVFGIRCQITRKTYFKNEKRFVPLSVVLVNFPWSPQKIFRNQTMHIWWRICLLYIKALSPVCYLESIIKRIFSVCSISSTPCRYWQNALVIFKLFLQNQKRTKQSSYRRFGT